MSVAMEIEEFPNQNPDYTLIAKKILASEPLFAEDLESQIKFARVWGGGKTQAATKDICKYLKLNEETIQVSSFHFQVLSTLKLSPTEVPAKFVAAIVKTVATRSSIKGSLIPAKAIKRTLEEHKVKVMEANELMVKAHKLCPDESSDFHRGQLECDMVEHVFATTEAFQKTSLTALVSTFVDTISNNNMPSSKPASSNDDDTPISMFDATAANAVHQLLQRKGINIGTIVQPRSQNSRMLETQFEVNHINDDGSIGIRGISINGGLDDVSEIVPMDRIPEYSIVKPEHRLRSICIDPPVFSECDSIYRMVADIGLFSAFRKHDGAKGKVFVQSVPKARLMARTNIAVEELTLVPWSYGVQAKPIEHQREARVSVEVCTTPPKFFSISSPPGLGKKFDVCFWRMHDEKTTIKLANMKFCVCEETVVWPVDIGHGKNVVVKITAATNTKAIKENQEIRVFVQPDKKRKAMKMSVDES